MPHLHGFIKINRYNLLMPNGFDWKLSCTTDLQVKDVYLKVPHGQGLGIELNEDVLCANLADGEEYWDWHKIATRRRGGCLR